jgi:hypothetical protein
MKKMLKTLAGHGEDSTTETDRAGDQFVDTLCQQIRSLNVFRLDRQQVAVRALVDFQADMGAMGNDDEARNHTYQRLVDFHGETLLLMHWSILGENRSPCMSALHTVLMDCATGELETIFNVGYTAIVKLLKKHHKRTGRLVQSPHLRELLSQPSWSTDVGRGFRHFKF